MRRIPYFSKELLQAISSQHGEDCREQFNAVFFGARVPFGDGAHQVYVLPGTYWSVGDGVGDAPLEVVIQPSGQVAVAGNILNGCETADSKSIGVIIASLCYGPGALVAVDLRLVLGSSCTEPPILVEVSSKSMFRFCGPGKLDRALFDSLNTPCFFDLVLRAAEAQLRGASLPLPYSSSLSLQRVQLELAAQEDDLCNHARSNQELYREGIHEALRSTCHQLEKYETFVLALHIRLGMLAKDMASRLQIVEGVFPLANIDKVLRRHRVHTKDVVKLMLLGNTGRGKSWLTDVLCGKEIFPHRTGGASVTRHVTTVLARCQSLAPGKYILLYDIPGLIEADEQNVELNRDMICETITTLPDAKTTVMIVFSAGNGGRLQNEDREAFLALQQYMKFDPKKLCLVVNQAPNFRTSDEEMTFKREFYAYAKRSIGTDLFPTFVSQIYRVRHRNNFVSEECQDAFVSLFHGVRDALADAKPVQVNAGAQIKLDRHKLLEAFKAEQTAHNNAVANLKAERSEERIDFEAKIEKQQKELNRLRGRTSSGSGKGGGWGCAMA